MDLSDRDFHIHDLCLHPAGLVVVICTTDDLDTKFFLMHSSCKGRNPQHQHTSTR